MKKVFSFVAAMMVALFAMVSCGTVQSAKDGMAAGEAYAKAFAAANNDIQAIAAAYDAAVKAAVPYATDQVQNATFLAGVCQSTEKASADCAGSFLAMYKLVSANAGMDATAGINALLDGLNDKAAVSAAIDNYYAMYTTPVETEVPAEDADAEDGDSEDADAEEE